MSNPLGRYGRARRERIDALAASTAGASGTSEGAVTVAESGTVRGEGVSLIASAWRRLRRNPVFLLGAGITTAFLLLALFAPWIAPHDPTIGYLLDKVRPQSNPIPGPEPGFPLGSDDRGRDLLSRLIVGSRQTLIVGVFATLGGLVGGIVLGTLAGALGGWADSLVMRIVDVMLSIPSLLLAVSISALATRPSQWTVITAIAIVNIPIFARLLRGSMLAQRHSDHVLAARALGIKPRAIVFRHMLPNALGPVIVQATLVLAVAIIDARPSTPRAGGEFRYAERCTPAHRLRSHGDLPTTWRGAVPRGGRGELRGPPGPDRRPGRRVRLRQVGDVAGDHGAAPPTR